MAAERIKNEVTVSPEKIFYREKKSIALYSSAHILCEVYG